jgi:hypothetical protein
MFRLTKITALALVASLALPAVSAVAQSTADQHLGESAKPAAQILADAVTAMGHLKDFHVAGQAASNGVNVGLNLSISNNGGGGSLSELGAKINLVTTSTFTYMKAGAASWDALVHNEAMGQELANRWLQVHTSDPQYASFSRLTFSGKFLALFVADPGHLSKLGMAAADGRSAIVVTSDLGSKFYIAAYGPPYLLKFTTVNVLATETLHMTDFGNAPMPTVPVNSLAIPGF